MKKYLKFLSYALSLCMLCTFFFSPSVLAATERTILLETTSETNPAFSRTVTQDDGLLFVEATVPATTGTIQFGVRNSSETPQRRIYMEFRGGSNKLVYYYNKGNGVLDVNAYEGTNSSISFDMTKEHSVKLIVNIKDRSYTLLIDDAVVLPRVLFTPVVSPNLTKSYADNNGIDINTNIGDGNMNLGSIHSSYGMKDMKVYLPSDADLQAYENKMQAYYRENMFEDDFEWGTDYNTVTGVDVGGTINNNISYVWKEGSALPTKSFGKKDVWPNGPSYYYQFKGADSGSTSGTDIKSTSVVKAEIINDDAEHGQVFHFKATDTWGSRGPFFRTGKVFTNRFVAVEYEAKFTDTTTSISNYMNPYTTGVSGDWQNTVSNDNHSMKTCLNTTTGWNSSDTVSAGVRYKEYLPERAGYFENGKLVGWHKITYLFDNMRDTYDFYVDDVLIVTDVSKLDRDSGTVKGQVSGLMMGQSSADSEIFVDNFKVYGMTDSQAADKTLAGFDNLFGTGVIPYHDSRLTNSFRSLSLPAQPFAGKNAIYQGIYKILDSNGKLISENIENKAVKYTFNTGASAGISAFVDTIFSYKLKSGVTLANGETMTAENFDFDTAYKYDGGKLSNMDDTYKSLGSAYMTMNGDVGGWTTDKNANITVSIEKGNATRTKTYNIVFQKDLASPQLYSGMEYGKPVFNNRLTSNQAYTTLYVAGRNVTDENLTYLAFIVLEKADGTIYKTAMAASGIGAGVDKIINHSYEWKDEDIVAMQGGKIKAFAWVNSKDGTYIPLTVIEPITTIPKSTSALN